MRMDYTAIVVALISLAGVIYQNVRNQKMAKQSDLRKEIQQMQGQLNIMSNGIKYELQLGLKTQCEKVLIRGDIKTDELKLIINMYHAYHALGGNDFITDLVERVKELPMA